MAQGQFPDDSGEDRTRDGASDARTGIFSSPTQSARRSTSDAANREHSTGNTQESVTECASGIDASTGTSAFVASGDSDLESNMLLGPYQLDHELGRGGMGVVWLATDPRLNRQVAIKTLHRLDGSGSARVAEFLDEGRCLAQLSHPDIVRVYDCGNEAGTCYLVSEFVPGGTLSAWQKRSPLTFEQSAALVARVADAAHYAHLRGIVHRDIKPANILMRSDGAPLLADFGLAISETEQLHESPSAVGTYSYMSPEQMRGDSHLVDGRADIYSLGVILYLLLTQRLPFLADTRSQYREQVLKRDPRPPRSVRDDIPAELEAICLKCLARNPADRYTTAADLASALRQHANRKQSFPIGRLVVGTIAALAAALLLTITYLGAVRSSPDKSADPLATVAAGNVANRAALAPQHAADGVVDDREVIPVAELRMSSPTTTWDVGLDGETLSFLSNGLALFHLGDYRGGDLELSVEIEQTHWDGGIGVFWAYSKSPDDRNFRQYESLTLYPQVFDEFRLRNAVARHFEPDNRFVQGIEKSVLYLPEVAPGPHRIGFAFRDGELASLTWDEIDLSDLVRQRDRNFRQRHVNAGGFGLIGEHSHGVFSQARIDGRRVRFERVTELR